MHEPKADTPADPPDEASQLDELVDEYGKEWRFWRDDRWCAAERVGFGRLPRRVEAPTADGLRAEIERSHLEVCEQIPFTTGDLR